MTFAADVEVLYWQISGLSSSHLYIIHTWLLIYVPFPQTISNNNNKNHDKKIEDCRRKLLKCPSWRLNSRCRLLNDLSNALYHRFEQQGGIEYLEESITYFRQGLNLCPIWDPKRSVFLNNFATAMTTRFEQLGRMDDLEEAITCHRQSLALRPHGHPDHSLYLDNLATAVFTRFQQLGRMDDL